MKRSSRSPHLGMLSRREGQIMQILLREKEGTVAEVLEQMQDPPGYDAVRTTLRILERKGLVEHREDGARYVYLPAISVTRARDDAMRQLVQTFFAGSAAHAALTLLSKSDTALTESQMKKLTDLIARLES
ncbi:MAG TPA: BlaI/MecI/CopY family transcriptional regulator [Thermoanaerobaculia bacterium]|nr:BlaI/MecI/CopY family transcriptional regulator [Thermoanaerobaculia bacterium]